MSKHNIHKKFFVQSLIGTFIITIAFFIDDYINDSVDDYLKNMKEKHRVQVKSFILLLSILLFKLSMIPLFYSAPDVLTLLTDFTLFNLI